MNDEFNNLFCSRNCKGFIILYDALGSYLLYYENKLLEEINEPLNPKELHKKHNLEILVPFKKFRDNENNYDFLKTIFNHIVDMIGDETKTQRIVMTILGDLIRSVKEAYIEPIKNFEHFSNAPQYIIDIARELSLNTGYNAEVFDKLVTPTSIEDAIKQRVNPKLTNEQKAKADAIAEEINTMGLLPYLNDILEPIHIGVHKNIYRKTLSEFNIMRGKGSYLGETTAEAEQGKSFEDEIVYKSITPENYIFEVNDITVASFVRYALINPRYFDRMTIYFGDLGAKKSFKKVEPIFNVIKPLITEGKYTYIKSDTNNDTDIIEIPLGVDSIGAVYQTTKNSFTEDEDQLISRTLYSTPANVEPKEIAQQKFYQQITKTKQSKAKTVSEQKLKDFGLYLMHMVNSDIEIINPYFDVFWDYASKSANPIREFNQQMELFNAYCVLTQNKCKREPYNTLFASEEQLKEYMDFVNLENALIPYEYDFLEMLLAKGKAKELEVLYDDFDIKDENGDLKEDIDITAITTLTECENTVIEQMNDKLQSKLDDYDVIQNKSDLTNKQLKELPRKLLSNFGFRSSTASKRIFFRKKDIDNYYSKRRAYKNIENVGQLLQTLYSKGYLGKYEEKHGKDNLYYLTPMCNNLTSDFELKKSYDRYVTDFLLNTGLENY